MNRWSRFRQNMTDARRTVNGETHIIRGYVIDAGGGQVGIVVDRNTKYYPPVGSRCSLVITGEPIDG